MTTRRSDSTLAGERMARRPSLHRSHDPARGRDLGDGPTLRIRGRPTETFRIGSFPWRINHGIEDGGSRHSRHGVYARRVLWGKQSIRRTFICLLYTSDAADE